MSKFIDITGQRFGKLVVVKREKVQAKGVYWLCRCDCGREKIIFGHSMKTLKTKTCGCGKVENGKRFRKRPFESLYNLLVRGSNAKQRHTLTYEEFLDFTCISGCHYCGQIIPWSPFNVAWNCCRYSLDRKDNTKGYTKENCVVCCKRCNRAKSDSFSYTEWVEIGHVIRRQREDSRLH